MTTLTLQGKYVLLQAENAKLRRILRKVGDAFSFWRELALHCQAERDLLQERLHEDLGQAGRVA